MESTKRVFDRTSDFKVFLFYFGNVASRNKNAEEKIYELLARLDKEAFQFSFEKSTRDREMLEDAKDYEKVKAAFLEKHQRNEDPSTIMKAALHARLDIENLNVLLNKLEDLYEKANFNVEDKFAMSQKAVSQYQDLAGMALFRVKMTLIT